MTTFRTDDTPDNGKTFARVHDGSLVEFECQNIDPKRAAEIIQSSARKAKAAAVSPQAKLIADAVIAEMAADRARGDQILPSEPAITNAGGMASADAARQKMMARDAALSAKPHWTAGDDKKDYYK